MREDIQQIVDRFNKMYLSDSARSTLPIKFNFYEENYQKTFDDNNYKLYQDSNKTIICSIEFSIKNKILVWSLHYLYGFEKNKESSLTHTNELKSFVRSEGVNLADDEYTITQFDTLQAGAEFIKKQIIKTYEKFQINENGDVV